MGRESPSNRMLILLLCAIIDVNFDHVGSCLGPEMQSLRRSGELRAAKEALRDLVERIFVNRHLTRAAWISRWRVHCRGF